MVYLYRHNVYVMVKVTSGATFTTHHIFTLSRTFVSVLATSCSCLFHTNNHIIPILSENIQNKMLATCLKLIYVHSLLFIEKCKCLKTTSNKIIHFQCSWKTLLLVVIMKWYVEIRYRWVHSVGRRVTKLRTRHMKAKKGNLEKSILRCCFCKGMSHVGVCANSSNRSGGREREGSLRCEGHLSETFPGHCRLPTARAPC